jgi:hypothetical protein
MHRLPPTSRPNAEALVRHRHFKLRRYGSEISARVAIIARSARPACGQRPPSRQPHLNARKAKDASPPLIAAASYFLLSLGDPVASNPGSLTDEPDLVPGRPGTFA